MTKTDQEDQFKVGDYVTSYYKGIFRIYSIEMRQYDTPLLHMTKVLSNNYKKLGGTLNCDSAWCKKIEKVQIMKELLDKIDLVKQVMV